MNTLPRPAWRTRAATVAALLAGFLVLAMCTVGASGPLARFIPTVIAVSAVAVGLWAVHRWRADRADYERRLTEWAAAEAVLAERISIARDLHDLASHGLGLITVRAASTRHLPQSDDIRSALSDIEETSRHATAELRRMLTVLREPAGAGPRSPAEGLETLPDIVRAAASAGLRPTLTINLQPPTPATDPPSAALRAPGTPADPSTGTCEPDPEMPAATVNAPSITDVSPGVQLAVCKTVREALSNVARHAGPTDVTVSVHRDAGWVVVTVADRGPAPGWRAMPGAGHGLAGLRERVGTLGGVMTAGPVEAGFRLTARIPDNKDAQ
ncbi:MULTISPECIES: histidine kinase [Actinoplanes]|uniref:sensor histidine kinase n=1 Tax=Actinoplanes TaxID=1865 RepID=UPI0005F2DAF7|nr:MULTISPECIES: histidine kinase [Actinoplanes]